MYCITKYVFTCLIYLCYLFSTAVMADNSIAADTNIVANTNVETWFGLLQLGGPVVIVLISMSVIGLTIIFYKLLQFRLFSNKTFTKLNKVLLVWCDNNHTKAQEELKTINSPISLVLNAGFLLLSQNVVTTDCIREELTRQAQLVLLQVQSMLRFMEQIAYLAPLLGLLGTVLGIIDVFHGMASQGQQINSGILAEGIWEALLTTAVGLSVAIPFALAHSMLESRADTIRIKMEDLLTRLFTC